MAQTQNQKLRSGGSNAYASKVERVQSILGDPSIYPDEFKSWIVRWLYGNVNLQIVQSQLPAIETFKAVGATGNAQFANSWVNYSGSDAAAAYMKDLSGFVHLKGTVKSGTLNSVIFTLPAGYRPQEYENFAVVCNGAFGVINIAPSGDVKMQAGGSNAYITLSGITFRAFK